MPRAEDVKKVLVVGSGPIQIGQAAEFDFSGSQACRALREEGVEVVLVNSNPATIMTDFEMADVIYIEPLVADVLAKIVEKERPDGILAGLGGQTALNLTAELAERGVLSGCGVKVLGTPLEAIYDAEDRERFKQTMKRINEPIPRGVTVNSVAEAEVAAALLLAAKRPVVSVNGNVAALAAVEVVKLGKLLNAPLEVNLFYRTEERVRRIKTLLEREGAERVLGLRADAKIPGIEHERAKTDREGIYSADVVLVPLEDGDRCEELVKMGKKLVAIDLNPFSRTSQQATVSIVDDLERALKNLINLISAVKNQKNQKKRRQELKKRGQELKKRGQELKKRG